VISPSHRPLPTQHTTNTTDELPYPQLDSNPRPPQSSRVNGSALVMLAQSQSVTFLTKCPAHCLLQLYDEETRVVIITAIGGLQMTAVPRLMNPATDGVRFQLRGWRCAYRRFLQCVFLHYHEIHRVAHVQVSGRRAATGGRVNTNYKLKGGD
jgi:hypothetical protein